MGWKDQFFVNNWPTWSADDRRERNEEILREREKEDEETRRQRIELEKKREAELKMKREKERKEREQFEKLTEEEKRQFVVSRAVEGALPGYQRSRGCRKSPLAPPSSKKKELTLKEEKKEAERIYRKDELEDEKRVKKMQREDRKRERERRKYAWERSEERKIFLAMSLAQRQEYVSEKDFVLKELKKIIKQCQN